MTLDALDQAFVDLWERRQPDPSFDPEPAASAPDMPPQPEPRSAVEPSDASPAQATATATDPVGEATDLVSRLLHTGRGQWQGLADEIEAARLAGHRVIAVTGGAPREGRTTLIACLAETLRDRGREVAVLTPADISQEDPGGPAGGGELHDKRIVLVDAGIWFRPGPIRRQRLAVASLGCDAAILVRRADRQATPALATALAAVGVAVLGEVLTFATSPGESQDAAGARSEEAHAR